MWRALSENTARTGVLRPVRASNYRCRPTPICASMAPMKSLWRRGLTAAATAIALAGVPAAAQAADDPSDPKYGLVKGCFTLKGADGRTLGPGPVRLQATTLGRYLLYTQDRRFVAAGPEGAPRIDDAASPAADLAFEDDATRGRYELTSAEGTKLQGGRFTAEPAEGCAIFPEAELNIDGAPSKGATPYGEARGFVDAHMHMMAFEFLGGDVHCGRPWHPYGITVALNRCKTPVVGDTSTAVVETVLGGGDPTQDPIGWPTFKDWPSYELLAHETSYYKWLERAYRGGLRIFVNLFVENGALCKLYPQKRNGCNEMESVRLQNKDLEQLEDYIDAQEGGPGKGWFRIVTDPFEARRVINDGKLAVVKGIEVSQLFDCGLKNDQPLCDTGHVDQELDRAFNMGVRDMELINKFDNGFGGVAGDAGQTGIVVNQGNKLETGKYWNMKTCRGPEEEQDREQSTIPGTSRDQLAGNVLEAALPPGQLPVYPAAPHCNQLGLSQLGDHLVRRMVDKGMLIDPDHLSVLARKQLLAITESKKYSGVVSSHSWSTDDAYPRIYGAGGFIAPYAGDSTSFVAQWKKLKAKAPKDFRFGMGYGADMNGFGHQGGPRPDAAKNPVVYPFKSWDGKQTIDRNKAGVRTWDLNTEGVAHYGLYPDWIEDLRKIAGDEIVTDMSYGPEAYLETWERAVGVQSRNVCREARLRFRPDGLGTIPLAQPAEEVLRTAGQPRTRVGRLWTWCVGGRAGGKVRGVYDAAGKLALVVSNAPRHRIAGLGRGSKAARVRGARAFGPGLRIRRAGKGRTYVYGVAKDGKLRFTGVATSATAKSPAALRKALRLAKL